MSDELRYIEPPTRKDWALPSPRDHLHWDHAATNELAYGPSGSQVTSYAQANRIHDHLHATGCVVDHQHHTPPAPPLTPEQQTIKQAVTWLSRLADPHDIVGPDWRGITGEHVRVLRNLLPKHARC